MARLSIPALILLAASVGDAKVFCQRKSSEVVVREACRKRETLLSPEALGIVGAPGAQGASGPRGEDGGAPFKVVDANGKTMGVFTTFIQPAVLVGLPGLDQFIRVFVGPDGYVNVESFPQIYYESSDCTGTGYKSNSYEYGPVPEAIVAGAAAFYETGPTTTITAASFEQTCTSDPPNTPRGSCCSTISTTRIAAPTAAVPLATLGFTPPFRLVPR
jgi:hypothetical protein